VTTILDDLPSPCDIGWHTCLRSYRINRAVTLRRLLALYDRARQVDSWSTEIEHRRPMNNDEVQEAHDRLRSLAIRLNMERDRLLGLRLYLEHCRVVHRRADRHEYEQIVRNLDAGIPASVTRQLLRRMKASVH
jgi:hypothetical protein